MASKSTGRGVVALLGALLILAGVAAGVVLLVEARNRPGEAIDQFARAEAGCSTRLSFNETGTYYVYREYHSVPPAGIEDCQPGPDAFGPFDFTLVDEFGADVPRSADDSIDFDRDGVVGESVARIDVTSTGEYVLTVTAEDELTLAAVGRDPDADVGRLRTGAILAVVAGLVLGLVLLLISGRGSKKAATPTMPEGPGWGPAPLQSPAPPAQWPPVAPQVPINPTQPDTPVAPAAPPPPLPSRAPAPPPVAWAPPTVGTAAPAGDQPGADGAVMGDAEPDDRRPPRRPAT